MLITTVPRYAAAAAAAVPAATNLEASEPAPPSKPVAISSANGLATTARAVKLMDAKEDTLEAVISGVNIVEADPKDMSVGYGGLPNEDGVVELDSCCMHGPSCNAGSVASIRDIKLPSRVAQLVLKRTDHVMPVSYTHLRAHET